jgi:regulatory protein
MARGVSGPERPDGDGPDKLKARIRNNAYALLRMRPRSESEMRGRLKLKGYAAPLVSELICELKKTGEIDDERFARFWVESRMHSNPMGDVVLRHELKQKGVRDAVIDAALEAKAKNYDEFDLAFSMAEERFERFKKLDRPKAMKRIYDFLLRRGFKYDNIRKVIESLIKA